MVLLSFVSYGQEQKYKLKKIKNISYVKEYYNDVPKYEKIKQPKKIKYNEYIEYSSVSLGISPYGNVDIEMRRKQKENGFGLDIYQDKVIYPDDFWTNFNNPNDPYISTDKVILNSNKRFGIGVYYITPLKYGFDISIGGGLLNYYLTTSIPNDFKPTTSIYWVFGFTKEVRITERLHLEGKGMFRNTRRYAQDIDNRVTKFEPSLGIRYDINFKK
jgi:hypothetical protein